MTWQSIVLTWSVLPRQVKYMTSDTVVALTLEREGAIRAWRMLAGPTNSVKGKQWLKQPSLVWSLILMLTAWAVCVLWLPFTAAKREKPLSIRALYGYDGRLNAVHGSDSIESAQREISFWFKPHMNKGGKPSAVTAASMSNHKFPEMSAYMNQVVDPIIAPVILRVRTSVVAGRAREEGRTDGR